MKNLKLIFGVFMVAAFLGATILSYTSNDHQAVRKDTIGKYIPTNG